MSGADTFDTILILARIIDAISCSGRRELFMRRDTTTKTSSLDLLFYINRSSRLQLKIILIGIKCVK